MARPLKEGLDYFPHDVYMSASKEIGKLEAVFGNDGYAVYNKLLEEIYKNGFKLFISDESTLQYYSKEFNIASTEKLSNILDFMAHEELFDKKLWFETKMLTSNRIRKTFRTVENKRVRSKKKYICKVSEAETRQKPEVKSAETDIVKESKVKESKVKESITTAIEVLHHKEPNQYFKFIESFGILYQQNTLSKFSSNGKHFALVKKLIDTHGLEEVNKKAAILANYCHNCSSWFTQNGFADFTIEHLSSQWNSLLPQVKKSDQEISNDKVVQLVKERRARDELNSQV